MENTNEPSKKRQRGLNYSPDEKLRILNICHKYKHIIESKMTDAVSWKQKDAWKSITNGFNSNGTVLREMHSLKKFYDNQKKNTRKIIAKNRSEVYKTGGGQIEAPAITSLDIATLEVMNATSVNGNNNDYDDDQVTMTNGINIRYSI